MKVKNHQLIRDQRFAQALAKVCGHVELSASDKLNLVKLRRDFGDHLASIQKLFEGKDKAQTLELLEDRVDFEFEAIDVKSVIDILSADDILILSGNVLKEV